MFFPDADFLSIPQREVHPAADRQAIVAPLDLSDESFSMAFRGPDTPDKYSVENTQLAGDCREGESAPEAARAKSFSEAISRGETALDWLLYDLSNRSGSSCTQGQGRFSILANLPSDERLKFVKDLCALSNDCENTGRFLEGRLSNIAHYLSAEEKSQLVSSFLDANQPRFASKILSSSRDLGELGTIIERTGERRLLDSGLETLRQLAAVSYYGHRFGDIYIPDLLCYGDGELARNQMIRSLYRAFDHCQSIIFERDDLIDTEAGRNFLSIVSYNRRFLDEHLNNGTAYPGLLNTLCKKFELELRYCLLFTEESPLSFGPQGKWTLSTLRQVESALSRVGEGVILTTPLLFEVERSSHLGNNTLGRRFSDGRIGIADGAVGNLPISAAYGNVDSLEVVFLHELGHSFQLGWAGWGLRFNNDTLSIDPGDPRYNFKDFLSLSGWKVIDPARFEVTNAGYSVRVDGTEFPLGYSTRFNDKNVVFLLNQGALYVHDADASFSLVPYSRTNPWEDWAEAFTEYHLNPSRLNTFAPEKFEYFEEEFARYGGNSELPSRTPEFKWSANRSPYMARFMADPAFQKYCCGPGGK